MSALPASPSVPSQPEADTRCVNAHDLCWQGGPCPYCEVTGYRDERGRFATVVGSMPEPGNGVRVADTATEDALRAEDWFHDSDMGAR
jgi:hypothetical protein